MIDIIVRPKPGIYSIVFDRVTGEQTVTTLDEFREYKRQRQRLILDRKRETHMWTAAKLWVAYFDQTLMGGWQCFLGDRHGDVWVNRDMKYNIDCIMGLFPYPSLFGIPFYDWMKWFAHRFERRRQDGRPVGVVYLWWKDRRDLSLSARGNGWSSVP